MSVKALMLENGVKAIYRVTGEIASAFKRTSTRSRRHDYGIRLMELSHIRIVTLSYKSFK
jgi:hypothetical protein